jgi:hypothetical protein
MEAVWTVGIRGMNKQIIVCHQSLEVSANRIGGSQH